MTYRFGISTLDDEIGGIEGGTNILVSGPAMSGKDSFVFSVLSEGIENGNGTIYVTTKDSGQEVINDFENSIPEVDMERFGVVDCVSRSQGMGDTEETNNIMMTSSPNDMTGIGIKVSAFLEEYWKEKGIKNNRIALNSISTLLMYSDLQTVFRFLHVFTGRVKSVDALGMYIIDSEMHDQQAYSTLKQLFDSVVEVRQGDSGNELRVTGLSSNPTDWINLEAHDITR